MKVQVLSEHGYEEGVLGFSLSYTSTIERTQKILSRYAFGVPGESKFLESMMIWVDVTAPRYWHQEADTYRVGTSKQSESTMHTLVKSLLTQENFEYPVHPGTLTNLNLLISVYNKSRNPKTLNEIKANLPEGFLQRRIWMFSYKTLQNMYHQRINHRLPQWKYFLTTVLNEIEHPEFIVKGCKNG